MNYTYTQEEDAKFLRDACMLAFSSYCKTMPPQEAARKAAASAHQLLRSFNDYPDSANEWLSLEDARKMAEYHSVRIPDEPRDLPESAYIYKNGKYWISRSYIVHLYKSKH